MLDLVWSDGDGITERIYFDWKCQNEINLFIPASLLLQHSDEIYKKRKNCQCSVWIYFTLEIYLCRLYTVLGLLFHPWILHANSYILQSMWSLKELLTFNIKEPAIISLMSSSATFSLLFIIFTKRFSVIRPLLVGSNDLRGNKSWQVCQARKGLGFRSWYLSCLPEYLY